MNLVESEFVIVVLFLLIKVAEYGDVVAQTGWNGRGWKQLQKIDDRISIFRALRDARKSNFQLKIKNIKIHPDVLIQEKINLSLPKFKNLNILVLHQLIN